MREGFLLEHRVAIRWISGHEEPSITGDAKTQSKEQRHVGSYRCISCGFLELYGEALLK